MILDMEESPTLTDDFLPPKLLKLCPDVLATLLHPVFCSIILTRCYPDICKSAMIRPVFENGDEKLIVNYCPISLLPKCSLLFEKLVYRHIYGHVWMKIHPKQFGCQSRKNSVSQLIDYLEYAHRLRTWVTSTVYLDDEKAFDKVPHTILLSKLRKFGLDESFIELLSSYLKDRIQTVKIANNVFDPGNIPSGVPQGSVLGRLVFILFINDLPSFFLVCIPWLFADDFKLLFNSLNFHNDLARLSNWNVSNGMIANSS